MKKLSTMLLISFFLFSAVPLFAEAVFLKDGEIIEGTIISDTDKAIEVRVGRTTRDIPRDDILRILYTDDYKQKRYIYTEDDKEIAGYIVAEDRNTYTVRTDLKSSDEMVLQKSDVSGVMRRSIRGEDEPEAEARSITISAGLYYKGFINDDWTLKDTPGDGDIDVRYGRQSFGLLGDIDLSPRFPVHLRGAFLYAAGELKDGPFGESLKEVDSLGFEFTGTICYDFYETGRFTFWAGPQIGFLYLDKEYEEFNEEDGSLKEELYIYTILFSVGGAVGMDFAITDSVYFTMDFGLRFVFGRSVVEVYDQTGGDDDDDFNLNITGTSAYLGFGMLYRF